MFPLEGHCNFCLWLKAVMALAEGYPPADLLMNRSLWWLGAEKSCRVWDHFAYLQLPDMKRVEKIPASPAAHAFHLSQSKSECKKMHLFLLQYHKLALACLHGGVWCSGLRLPPDLPCWSPATPASSLRGATSTRKPWQFASTGPDACDGEDKSQLLSQSYVLGREPCLVVGVR